MRSIRHFQLGYASLTFAFALAHLPETAFDHLNGFVLDKALRGSGALVVTGVPGLSEANGLALRSLASCGSRGFEGFNQKSLPDGSERWTLAAEDGGDMVQGTVTSRCPGLEKDLSHLRGVLGLVGEHIVGAAELSLGSSGPAKRHGGFSKLLQRGRVVEHFHLYAPAKAPVGEAVPLHSDNGGLLIFSKALTFFGGSISGYGDEGRGLFAATPEGYVQPHIPGDAAVVFAGEALRSFLGSAVQIQQHAVRLQGFPVGSLRAWHGRMYVFAKDDLSDAGVSAGSLFLAPLAKTEESEQSSVGAAWNEGLRQECATRTETCWTIHTKCVAVCNDGQYEQCLMPNLTKGHCGPTPDMSTPAYQHCDFRCPMTMPMPSPSPDPNAFCVGSGGMDMSMSGFITVFKQHTCIVLFFKQWRLDAVWKFVLASIFVVFLGIASQGVITLRSTVQTRWPSYRIADALLFGLSATIGWFLMLVVMTYCLELFLCSIFGLTLGVFLFRSTSVASPCCTAEASATTGQYRRNELPTRRPLLKEERAFKAVINVEGMTCGSCTSTVRNAVMAINGVAEAQASLEAHNVEVSFQPPAKAQEIVAAIDDVGFSADLVTQTEIASQ